MLLGERYDNEIFTNAERWRMTLEQFLVRSGRFVSHKKAAEHMAEMSFTPKVPASLACLSSCEGEALPKEGAK